MAHSSGVDFSRVRGVGGLGSNAPWGEYLPSKDEIWERRRAQRARENRAKHATATLTGRYEVEPAQLIQFPCGIRQPNLGRVHHSADPRKVWRALHTHHSNEAAAAVDAFLHSSEGVSFHRPPRDARPISQVLGGLGRSPDAAHTKFHRHARMIDASAGSGAVADFTTGITGHF